MVHPLFYYFIPKISAYYSLKPAHYSQSVTSDGENIIPLAITKTVHVLIVYYDSCIVSLQIVGYSLLMKIPVVCQTFSYVM